MRTHCLLLTLCCLASGCMGNAGFLAPGPLTASDVPRVDGTWRGTDTITGVFLGECVGPAMQSRVGAMSAFELAIRQDGLNVSGTNAQPDDETVCPIQGFFLSGHVFIVNPTGGACEARSVMGFVCPDGEVRDLRHESDSVPAVGVFGEVLTGTRIVEYGVYRAGSATGRLATLRVNSEFRLQRQ